MNNTAAATTRKSARYHAEAIASDQKQADAYAKLAENAKALGLEYEAERLINQASEFDAEVDDRMTEALADGWTPEDIEDAWTDAR